MWDRLALLLLVSACSQTTPATTPDGGSTDDMSRDPAAWQLGQPVSLDKPAWPERAHPLPPTKLDGTAPGPRPTNAFFMNLVLGQGDQRINLLPYHIYAQEQALGCARPAVQSADKSITTAVGAQLRLGASELFGGHAVRAQDPLSITMEWTAFADHHFHYGYLLYAAAVLARLDPAWGQGAQGRLRWLLRDIANPSAQDPHFPRFRHMDFFVGHSWASGLFVFGDNRNQESTSEAVNAWHAVALLGQALKDDNLTRLGQLLQSVEIASAQAYWQVRADSAVYADPFRKGRVVGVLWSTKADAVTFFGANPEYVFGIQMIPILPISEALLDPAWVRDAWPAMQAAAAGASPGWRGFLYLAHGLIAPDLAFTEVQGLNGFDDGNSRTNSLYFAATRP